MTVSEARQAEPGRDLQYLTLAKAYAIAAIRLARTGETIKPIQLPFFQLVAHAMELSIKATLSFQGSDEEDLMRIGHDLRSCRRWAVRGGLAALDRSSETTPIDALSQPHAWQAFRYPQRFHWELPDIDESLSVLADMIDAVEAYIASDAQ